jgi:hypothetical protein
MDIHTGYPSTLEGIKDELLSLSNRSSLAGYQQNEEDLCAVCELTEALRDAIVEYQVSIQLVSLQNSLLTQ